MTDRKRYHGLDAMRGIAALSVVVFHIGNGAHQRLFPHAYLAVDFFFMLSGFVLAKAYEPRLRNSLSATRFLGARFIRLYPLFALGVLLGIARVVSRTMGSLPHSMTPVEALFAFTMNALMLPAPTSPTLLFPFNAPAWSLFLEIVINIGFAALFCRMASRFLAMSCLGAGGLLAFAILRQGHNDLGAIWSTAGFGLLRVCFAFLLGILLARLPGRVRKSSPMALLPIIGFALLLAFPWPPAFGEMYDLVAVFVLLPALLWLSMRIELPEILHGAGAALGDISYPLYAIHFPLLQVFLLVFFRGLHLPLWLVSLLFLAGIVWLSWYLAHRFDAPIRRWLSGRARLRPAAMPVGP
ncbi:MAG: acyltransferase [Proteobacteria bacterium]|nr:acyltransferase [Pseudomonadota bacterium]